VGCGVFHSCKSTQEEQDGSSEISEVEYTGPLTKTHEQLESITSDMVANIKELFWDNTDAIIQAIHDELAKDVQLGDKVYYSHARQAFNWKVNSQNTKALSLPIQASYNEFGESQQIVVTGGAGVAEAKANQFGVTACNEKNLEADSTNDACMFERYDADDAAENSNLY